MKNKNNKSLVRRISSRIKKTAKRAARKVKAAAKTVARKIAGAAKGVARTVKKAAAPMGRALKVVGMPFARTAKRAWHVIASAWRAHLKPFLKSWGLVNAAVLWAALLAVAPIPTVAATGAAGLMALAAAKGISKLEKMSGKLARFASAVLEVCAQTLQVLFYTASAAMIVLSAAVSLPMMLVYVVDFMWTYIRKQSMKSLPKVQQKAEERTFREKLSAWFGGLAPSTPIPAAVHTVPTVTRRKRATDLHTQMTQRQRIPVIDVTVTETSKASSIEVVAALEAEMHETGADEIAYEIADIVRSAAEAPVTVVAKGAEDVMPACDACGIEDRKLRIRAPFNHDVAPSDDWLCSACHAAACEEDALRLTGVSLTKTHVMFRYLDGALRALPECTQSQADVDNVVWTVHATGWWRDRRNNVHDREWTMFHLGEPVGVVRFDHGRNGFFVSVHGEKVGGLHRTAEAARAFASDVYFDRLNAAIAQEVETASSVISTANAVSS